MPKVVVYVPQAAWRRLEEQGLDPAAAVREFARRGYESSDRIGIRNAVGTVVAQLPDPKPNRPANTGCPMVVPYGTRCKACGQIHKAPAESRASVTPPGPGTPRPVPSQRDGALDHFKPDPK